jgi:hypothetical protein
VTRAQDLFNKIGMKILETKRRLKGDSLVEGGDRHQLGEVLAGRVRRAGGLGERAGQIVGKISDLRSGLGASRGPPHPTLPKSTYNGLVENGLSGSWIWRGT